MTATSPPIQDISSPADLSTTVDAPRFSGPFTDLTPYAHGGLGEVFRATDTELHRTVAVKRLHARHAKKADINWRFLLEAEITARLEHPGVIPVYRLFRDADDQPAYAMRFVEGQTLAGAIDAFHSSPPDPVAFRRLLQSFLQICQTIAFAHSRGIIHRDLKPANVLIGKFGETLVIDWGLAKVVGRPEEARDTGAGETLVPSGADSDSGETAMGSAVGTPAYMSPEQAAGRWDVVAQPSDVYGLGAILYTLLTGRPPLEKGNWPEMQQRIQRGDFPRPRHLKPDVPRPLEAVCLQAMALDPAVRYSSAAALAADIERWLADEPVLACREPWSQRLARWARRNKPVVIGLLAFLVTAVIALSVSTWIVTQQKAETELALHQKVTAIERYNQSYTTYHKLRQQVGGRLGSSADMMAKGEGLTGDQHYHIACMYALAYTGSPTARGDEFANQAVPHLRLAADRGFFKAPSHIANLRTDPDLAAVRDRVDFEQFVQEIESQRKNGAQ